MLASRALRAVATPGLATPSRHGLRALSSVKPVLVDNPYTGDTVAEVPMATSAEAELAVSAAVNAQREWAEVPLDNRIDTVKKFVAYVTDNKDAIATEISLQMGKPLQQALNEVAGMEERAVAMMDLAPAALADDPVDYAPAIDGLHRRITREPVGVALCIAPFNYPLLTAVNAVIPAILAGNAVVLKSSPRTPLCAHTAFRAGFDAAGAPSGLLSPVDCDNSVTNAVIHNPSVAAVSFTGSVEAGHSVYRAVADRFVDATLELGGKDAAYVAEDADLDAAVAGVADGAFYNAGQSCCGLERVYVHSSLYDQFLEGITAAAKAYTLGDPLAEGTTMGPMASPAAPAFLKEQVDEAVELGAQLLCGGEAVADAAGKGRFFAPTVLADCDHRMSVVVEESFGPVLAVSAVDSDDEAVAHINNCNFGLTSAIYTRDAARARAVGRQLQVGTVFMNRCDYLDPYLAWTGAKDSGKGLSLSRHGFDAFTRFKSWNMKV